MPELKYVTRPREIHAFRITKSTADEVKKYWPTWVWELIPDFLLGPMYTPTGEVKGFLAYYRHSWCDVNIGDWIVIHFQDGVVPYTDEKFREMFTEKGAILDDDKYKPIVSDEEIADISRTRKYPGDEFADARAYGALLLRRLGDKYQHTELQELAHDEEKYNARRDR